MADQKQTEKKPHSGSEFSLFPELDPNSAILTAEEVRSLVARGELITGSTFDERCLQSTCYDIRIGKKGIVGGVGKIIDLTEDPLIIEPGCYAARNVFSDSVYRGLNPPACSWRADKPLLLAAIL